MDEFLKPGKVSLRHLRSFVVAARTANLTRAAQALYVSQSALSLTILQLEAELGIKLFDRSTRSFNTTAAGEEFIPIAERLLKDMEAALRSMRALGNLDRGAVGLAAVPSVMTLAIPGTVARFIHDKPGINVYLREENAEGVQRRLLAGDIDFGIANLWREDAQLDFEPLFHDRYGVLYAPPSELDRGEGALTWRALECLRVIGFSSDWGLQNLLMSEEIPEHVRRPRYEVSNTVTIAALISEGAGVSVMSALGARRPPLDRLSFRLLRQPVMQRTVGILTRKGRGLSPAASFLLDRLRKELVPHLNLPGVTVLSRNRGRSGVGSG
ncbi:MAG TPA: LysR substrate-binding domain-containing protein, partial [Burkholderiaceae bacterium]|nr:LysR substrate-binding domain-containing protein [Burkholderiaceae bacterium]